MLTRHSVRFVVVVLCCLVLSACGCSGACVKATTGAGVAGVSGFFYCLFNECVPASSY